MNDDGRLIQARIYLREIPPGPELVRLSERELFPMAAKAIAACQLSGDGIRDRAAGSRETLLSILAQMRARLMELGRRAREDRTLDGLPEGIAGLIAEMEERA